MDEQYVDGGAVAQDAGPQFQVQGMHPMDTGRADFMRWQLNTDSLLFEIENYLRGKEKVWNEEKGDFVWEEHCERRILSEEGIARIRTVLNPRLTRLLMLSDLEEDSIRLCARDCAMDVNNLLYEEGETFSIATHDVPIVVNLVWDLVYTTARRSYRGGERRLISLIQQVVEQNIRREETDKPKASMLNPFSWLPGFKRR